MPIRVLVAEDSPTYRELLVTILQSTPDLQVIGTARNGTEAVRLAKRLRPDVITMDIYMPEMDGIEATQIIRGALAPERQPRIVAITAAAMTEDQQACLAAGMDSFLTKPVRPEHLMQLLQSMHE